MASNSNAGRRSPASIGGKASDRFFTAPPNVAPACVAELSFDGVPAAPYPPPALAGLQPHDAQRWGGRHAEDGRPVVRLADLVRLQSHRTGRVDVRPLAIAVLQRLVTLKPGAALFMLRLGDAARPVADQDVWRWRCRSGDEHYPPYLSEDEARAKGNPLDDDEAYARNLVDYAQTEPYWPRRYNTLAALPELPELRGPGGALAWLRWCWGTMATGFDDLDDTRSGRPGALAVLQSDAVEVFGAAGAEVRELAHVRLLPTPGITSADSAEEKAVIAATKPPAGFVKGAGWTPACRAALLAQYVRLCKVCQSAEAALIHLHTGWGYSKAKEKSGGPLSKVLTKARVEARDKRGQVHRAQDSVGS